MECNMSKYKESFLDVEHNFNTNLFLTTEDMEAVFDYQKEKLDNIEDDLFEYLAHGAEKHRAWLKKAIVCFFNEEKRPEEE